jgi:D-alanyl-D-alanine dipeptidase
MFLKTFFTTVFLWSSLGLGEIRSEMKEVALIPGVKIDLRYASTNNFVGTNLYGNFNKAYLHPVAFAKLQKAESFLEKKHTGYKLLVFDALRPRSVQRLLFAKVAGTPQEGYVANPDRGSVHNYGFAVDLTVADENGKELDMGTGFDNFTDLAQPRYEEKFLAEKKLSEKQLSHRKLLREVMEEAGFLHISNEWWHFDGLPIAELKEKYRIIE